MKWWRIVLMNRVLRHVLHATPWRFGLHWVWLRDEPGSKTLELVYREINRGDYAIPVELQKGDIVLDLGAHVGMFSIPLAIQNPGVEFHLVEPDWRNYRNLLHNTKGVPNIQTHHAAVGQKGAAGTRVIDASNTGSTRTTWVPGPGNGPYLPESIPIREWVKIVGGQVKLLKMDIEGAEFQDFNPEKDLEGVACVVGEVHRWGGDAEALVGAIRAAGPLTRLQIHA